MTTFLQDLRSSLAAEWIKSRYTPMRWMTTLGGGAVTTLIFALFYFNTAELLEPSENPWPTYTGFSFAVASLLLLTPFIVLLASTAVHPEHRGHSWKYLYSLPLGRSPVYLAKFVLIMGALALAYSLLFAGIFGTGFLLGLLRPDYDFVGAAPGLGSLARNFLRSYLASLGILALQYALSVWWRNYLLPIGIGLAGYIITPILIGKTSVVFALPNAYPILIAQGLEANPGYAVTDHLVAGLSTVEWYSLGYVLVFLCLGSWMERRRNIA